MTQTIDLALLAGRHRRRLVDMAGASDTLMVATSVPGVVYCSGYRSMGYDTDPRQSMAVVFDAEEWVLVGPTADLWAAQEIAGADLRYRGHGTFYFDQDEARAAESVDFHAHASFDEALAAAVSALSAGKRSIAVEGGTPAGLETKLEAVALETVAKWFRDARAVKDPDEIALLKRATEATEQAIASALSGARAGMSELDLSAAISADMIRAGLRPGFVVVTSGHRASFADAHASARRLSPGDLVRLDVGGTLAGYWSDTAHSAVVGNPDAATRAANAAITAGQKAGLSLICPGAMTDRIFQATVEAVRAAGLPFYRRHHVGHGLGLDSHEYPAIGPANPVRLEPGMIVNIEAPYYRPLWGGLMHEDTLLVTETGAERFTRLGTDLFILPA